jgi:ubiquinol-cytochrome c reductase cytochrome c1 subunit
MLSRAAKRLAARSAKVVESFSESSSSSSSIFNRGTAGAIKKHISTTTTTGASSNAGASSSSAAAAASTASTSNRGYAAGATVGASLAFATAFGATTSGFVAFADEAEHGLHLPQYSWPHDGLFDSYDHASIRRGHQVYQQVCAACHSLNQICYRNLVDVAYTEQEVKAMAEEIEITDGPDDTGEMFERPGKLSDRLPSPYANEEGARYANNGAYPPDLSLITKARHDGINYVFALLLGYRDAPAGIEIRDGLYYNPYFPGGAIAMPKMLVDGGVEYDDGTVATETQMAKDVTTFLAWAAEPEHDDRKLMGAKWMFAMALLTVTAVYQKRYIWSQLKSRRVIVDAVR